MSAGQQSWDQAQTTALVDRLQSMIRELEGPYVKPFPPTVFGITGTSLDHPQEVYRDVILPMYGAMSPPPRTAVTKFEAGVHDYARPEAGLPLGVAPAVISQWNTAIENGFFDV